MNNAKKSVVRKSSPVRPSRFGQIDADPFATSKSFHTRASEALVRGQNEEKLLEKSNQLLKDQLREQQATTLRLKKGINELTQGNTEREGKIEELSQRITALETCLAETEGKGQKVLASIARARKTVHQLTDCIAPEAEKQIALLERQQSDLQKELDEWGQKHKEQNERLVLIEAEDLTRKERLARLREERGQATLLLHKFMQLKTSFTEKINERAKSLLVENQRIDLLDKYTTETLKLCRIAEC